jgi:hypothetical protein
MPGTGIHFVRFVRRFLVKNGHLSSLQDTLAQEIVNISKKTHDYRFCFSQAAEIFFAYFAESF